MPTISHLESLCPLPVAKAVTLLSSPLSLFWWVTHWLTTACHSKHWFTTFNVNCIIPTHLLQSTLIQGNVSQSLCNLQVEEKSLDTGLTLSTLPLSLSLSSSVIHRNYICYPMARWFVSLSLFLRSNWFPSPSLWLMHSQFHLNQSDSEWPQAKMDFLQSLFAFKVIWERKRGREKERKWGQSATRDSLDSLSLFYSREIQFKRPSLSSPSDKRVHA